MSPFGHTGDAHYLEELAAAQVRFEVPGVPVPWKRTRVSRIGRMFTPTVVRTQKERLAHGFRVASSPLWRLDGMYRMDLVFVLPDRRVKDWDNLGKLVSDALNGIAYGDDNQVVYGSVEKLYEGESRTIVTLTRLGDWPCKRAKKPRKTGKRRAKQLALGGE